MPEPDKLFTVYVNCENEAFQDRKFASEITRILHVVAGNMATGKYSGAILDVNGNTVGNWHTKWTNDDPADRPPPRRKGRSR